MLYKVMLHIGYDGFDQRWYFRLQNFKKHLFVALNEISDIKIMNKVWILHLSLVASVANDASWWIQISFKVHEYFGNWSD